MLGAAPASDIVRAQAYGGGLSTASNYFLEYTPVITVFSNEVPSGHHGGTANVKTDLEKTSVREGIHALPRGSAFVNIYNANYKKWDDLHRDAHSAAGDKRCDGGN